MKRSSRFSAIEGVLIGSIAGLCIWLGGVSLIIWLASR